MKKAPVFVVFAALLALGSCLPLENGGPPGSNTVVFVFRDAFTDTPVSGVVMVVNGQTLTSDESGTVDTGVAAGGVLSAYFDPAALEATGYYIASEALFDAPDFFAFTVPISFIKVFHLVPQNPPPGLFTIGGVARVKGSTVTPITGSGGEVNAYTSWGSLVGYADINDVDGTYSIIVPAADLVFVVTEYTAPEYTHYHAFVSVTGNASVNLSYTAADITLEGTTSAADVYASLQLGDTAIELATAAADGSFSVDAPFLPGSVLRLHGESFGPDAVHTFLDQDLAASTTGISLIAATGGTVPNPWTANLAWDGPSQTLTWDPAGEATAYHVSFTNEVFFFTAIVTASPLIVPPSFDIETIAPGGFTIMVRPLSSDGAFPPVAPTATRGTTVIQHNPGPAFISVGGG